MPTTLVDALRSDSNAFQFQAHNLIRVTIFPTKQNSFRFLRFRVCQFSLSDNSIKAITFVIAFQPLKTNLRNQAANQISVTAKVRLESTEN